MLNSYHFLPLLYIFPIYLEEFPISQFIIMCLLIAEVNYNTVSVTDGLREHMHIPASTPDMVPFGNEIASSPWK